MIRQYYNFWAIFATSDLVMNILRKISIFKISMNVCEEAKNSQINGAVNY